jgi:glycosyltransferase involved in cell wall biosynthesis
MDKFIVSVIMPVYNAEKFLRKAVESAVKLEEVGEIILVEDASPDNALMICQELEKEYAKVKLFRHPNGENKGAGASRNLGMEKASCDFISFLDADDWYLPNRFHQTILEFEDPEVEGVYEPIGTYFHGEYSFMFGKKISKEDGEKIITFLREPVDSDNLFYSLLSQSNSNFSTDGVTLRKCLVEKVGLFSESLKLHQDSEFWMRCAYYGKLVTPKNPGVVAIRGVHGENRINSVNFYSKAKFYESLFERFYKEDLSFKERMLLYKKHIFFNPERKFQNSHFIKKYSEVLKITFKTLLK